jgi:hypothetical protein
LKNRPLATGFWLLAGEKPVCREFTRMNTNEGPEHYEIALNKTGPIFLVKHEQNRAGQIVYRLPDRETRGG